MSKHYGFISKLKSKHIGLNNMSIYSLGLAGAPLSDFKLYFIPSDCFKDISHTSLIYRSLQLYAQFVFFYPKEMTLNEAIEGGIRVWNLIQCDSFYFSENHSLDDTFNEYPTIPKDSVFGIFQVLRKEDVLAGFVEVDCEVLQFNPCVLGVGGQLQTIDFIPSS